MPEQHRRRRGVKPSRFVQVGQFAAGQAVLHVVDEIVLFEVGMAADRRTLGQVGRRAVQVEAERGQARDHVAARRRRIEHDAEIGLAVGQVGEAGQRQQVDRQVRMVLEQLRPAAAPPPHPEHFRHAQAHHAVRRHFRPAQLLGRGQRRAFHRFGMRQQRRPISVSS
jgi:hypothetical protein